MAKGSLTILILLVFGFLHGQQINMLADPSYLQNGGAGVQAWEDEVLISGVKLDGSSGNIIYDTQFRDRGFGVDGGRWRQLDYYETPSPRSEEFRIDFQGTVNSLVVTTGMMGLNEGGSGFSETGKWTAYDTNGQEIGTGLLGPEYSELGFEVKQGGSYGIYPIACDPGSPISSLSIEVTGFGHGEGSPRPASYGENNSDFNIVGISYNRLSYDNGSEDLVAVNDGPFSVNEDQSLSINTSELLQNDIFPEGEVVSISSVSTIGNIGVVNLENEVLNYIPSPNLNGVVQLQYTIESAGGAMSSAAIDVLIVPVNDRPFTGADGPFYTNKNTTIFLTATQLLANDGDIDGDEIVFYEAIAPENGTMQVFGENIRWTPNPDYVGVEGLFAYTITDNKGLFATREVGIVVLDNRSPIAVKDTIEVDENSSVTVQHSNLLLNDSDPDGDVITFDTIYPVAGGGLDGTLDRGTNSFTYTPDPGFVGLDFAIYRISDGSGSAQGTGIANVVFKVIPSDIDPIVQNGTYIIQSAISPEESLQVDGLGNRSSALLDLKTCDDREVWTISERVDGFYEILNVAADKALEAWRPSPGNGDDATIYSANGKDWQAWSFQNGGEGTIKIKGKYNPRFLTNSNGNAIVLDNNSGVNQQWILTPVEQRNCSSNNDPIAGEDVFNINEDNPLDATFASLLSNDTDPDNDLLSIVNVVLDNSEQGQLTTEADGFSFMPLANLNGEVRLSYTVSDGQGGESVGLIVVNINPINDRPFTGADGPFIINKNELLIINASQLLANDGDIDGDQIAFFEAIAPENGTLEVFGEIIRFRPLPDYVGNGGLFAYTITDGNGSFATREVGIIVLDNRPPDAVKDTFELEENTSITVDYSDLLLNDSDPDGDEIFFDTIYTIGGLDGTLIKGTNSFTYTPDPGYVGVDIITYRIEDDNGSRDFANIVLVVKPVEVGDIEINGQFLLLSNIDESSLQVSTFSNRSSVVSDTRTCDETEIWNFTYLENGFHKLVNVAAEKAMEAWTRNPSNGDNVTIYSDNGFDWQQWEITNGGEGTFVLTGKYNNRKLTNSNGNAIVLDNNNGVNQQWILVPIEESGCDVESQFSLSASEIDLETGSWGECVEIEAYDYDGQASLLGRNGDRLGILSGRYEFQVDYDASSGSSEKLVVHFNRSVDDLQFTIGNLERREYQGVLDETGKWTAYDASGMELGSGMISPDMGTEVGGSMYQFILSIAGIHSLEFEATPYGHGEGSSAIGNNSDFSLMGIDFTSSETCVQQRDIDLKEKPMTLQVFPNPVSTTLNLAVSGKGTLSFHDQTGKLLSTQWLEGDHEIQLSVGDYMPGIYFITYSNEVSTKRQKVLVVR